MSHAASGRNSATSSGTACGEQARAAAIRGRDVELGRERGRVAADDVAPGSASENVVAAADEARWPSGPARSWIQRHDAGVALGLERAAERAGDESRATQAKPWSASTSELRMQDDPDRAERRPVVQPGHRRSREVRPVESRRDDPARRSGAAAATAQRARSPAPQHGPRARCSSLRGSSACARCPARATRSWAIQRAYHRQRDGPDPTNAEIAAAFDELGDLYELDGAVSTA